MNHEHLHTFLQEYIDNKLTPDGRRCLKLLLDGELTDKQICDELSRSHNYVYKWKQTHQSFLNLTKHLHRKYGE